MDAHSVGLAPCHVDGARGSTCCDRQLPTPFMVDEGPLCPNLTNQVWFAEEESRLFDHLDCPSDGVHSARMCDRERKVDSKYFIAINTLSTKMGQNYPLNLHKEDINILSISIRQYDLSTLR